MIEPTGEAKLRELADLEAIRDLARRYAHCVWQKDAAGAVELFTEDAVMDTGDRPAIVGRDAILASYTEIFASADLHPFVHNHVVELDGRTATGTCYLDLRSVMDGKTMTGHGFYQDRYVRVGESWKFAHRLLTMVDNREI